jgi:uncharacterized protein (DUF697 family)
MAAETTPTAHHEPSTKSRGQDDATYETRLDQGQAIIRRNVLWALGAGVVPFPIVDVLAILAVEMKMLKQLSDVYEVKFTEGVAKKITGSLLTSLGSVGIGAAIGGSLVKLVPVIGTTLGLVSVPIFAGAFTNAMGRVFQMHFETGGTLLDFDPKTVRSHFKHEFEKSKKEVSQLQHEMQAKTAKS